MKHPCRRPPAGMLPAALSCALLAGFLPAFAENPYLHCDSNAVVTSAWSGHVWGDEIEAPGEEGLPVKATCTTRRLANMPWGQIVRVRFSVEGDQEILPLYFLARDEVILELIPDDGDIELVIGVVAGMPKPPHYEPKDVRAQDPGPALATRHGTYDISVGTTGDTCTFLSSHPSGHFRKMVWKRGVGLVEYGSGVGARQKGFSLSRAEPLAPQGTAPPEAPELEARGFTATERIGPFALGMTGEEVLALAKAQPFKGKNEHWAADGTWRQSWQWPHLGLEISMASDSEAGAKHAAAILLNKPGEWRTSRGIGIGSSEAEARKAYRQEISQTDSTPGRVVAGSVYDGLICSIEQGKVSALFLGAAAE